MSELYNTTIEYGTEEELNKSLTENKIQIDAKTGAMCLILGNKVIPLGIGSIEIVDNLTSLDTDKALSAKQGRVLDDKINRCEKVEYKMPEIYETSADPDNYYPTSEAVKNYVKAKIGDIETTLDSIIAIQNTLIGGESI